MSKKVQPLLASKADMEKIQYPVLASPKLDGIRCLIMEDGAKSRNMKPIPNKYIRQVLGGLPCVGFDGELMLKDGGDFNKVQSAVMSQTGTPAFYYAVFDTFEYPDGTSAEHVAFENRYEMLKEELIGSDFSSIIRLVGHVIIANEQELTEYLRKCIDDGFEGVMIRCPKGRYKFGRSTVREGILLKIKEFFDDEGVLVEIIEKQHNANKLEKDELGYAKRSQKKENLVPAGTSGALVVRWKGRQFKVGFGPGLDDAIKQDWWDRQDELVGQKLKFRYQELSKDGIPRFGKALGFRHEGDMS